MNDCRKTKKLLSRYLDLEINLKEVTFVKEHLKQCPLCNREYEELLQLKRLLLEKERKTFPLDYLVLRLREEIAGQESLKERISWIESLGNLSRRLIPVPVTAIVLTLVFMIFSLKQPISEYSIEEHILSGAQTTTEIAARLILGIEN